MVKFAWSGVGARFDKTKNFFYNIVTTQHITPNAKTKTKGFEPMEFRLNIKNKNRNETKYLCFQKEDINNEVINYINNNLDKNYYYITNSFIHDSTQFNNLMELLNKIKNLTILLTGFSLNEIDYLKDNRYNFGLHYPITSYQEANEIISLGAKEILIHGELGFNYDWIMSIKNKFDIQISCSPQFAYVYNKNAKNLCNFFIPPRVINKYDYIDIVDFMENNLIKEATLYKVYKKDKRWDGNLKQLISGLNVDIDERYLLKDDKLNFFEIRKNCKQKCMQNVEKVKCSACSNMAKLSMLLSKQLPNY